MQKSAVHTVAVHLRGSWSEVSGLISSGISTFHTVPHCSADNLGITGVSANRGDTEESKGTALVGVFTFFFLLICLIIMIYPFDLSYHDHLWSISWLHLRGAVGQVRDVSMRKQTSAWAKKCSEGVSGAAIPRCRTGRWEPAEVSHRQKGERELGMQCRKQGCSGCSSPRVRQVMLCSWITQNVPLPFPAAAKSHWTLRVVWHSDSSMQIWVFCLITEPTKVISYIEVFVAVWLPLNWAVSGLERESSQGLLVLLFCGFLWVTAWLRKCSCHFCNGICVHLIPSFRRSSECYLQHWTEGSVPLVAHQLKRKRIFIPKYWHWSFLFLHTSWSLMCLY